MRFRAAALVLFCLCPSLHAGEQQPKEETASTQFVMTRPREGGAFAGALKSFRQQADHARPFEWKDVDEKIDTWFAEAIARFPEEHQKHAGNWEALREQSKRDARTTLAPVEEAWKTSIAKTADAFETSEAEFYARRPSLRIEGTYRYFEGQRDRSAVNPSWQLANAKSIGHVPIRASINHDCGDKVLRAAGMNLAMFDLQCAWEMSLEAAMAPDSLKATPIGSINTPTIRAWIVPRFECKSKSKITTTWKYYDKTSTPIGPVTLSIGNSKISTSWGLGADYNFEALDDDLTQPELTAGRDQAPLAD